MDTGSLKVQSLSFLGFILLYFYSLNPIKGTISRKAIGEDRWMNGEEFVSVFNMPYQTTYIFIPLALYSYTEADSWASQTL